jgi:succinyl-diaminopimelate desuccinylase
LVVSAIRDETGVEPILSTSGGTSDGRFLIRLCPVVDFGLPNATMHKVGEHAAIADIESLTRIYRRTIEGAFA